MAEQIPSFQTPRRSTTVVVAMWLLGVAAFLELLFASIALSPRVLTALRNNATTASSPALPSSTLPAPPTIQTPVSNPLENATLKENPKTDDSSSAGSLPPPSTDASLQGGNALGIVSVKLDGSSDGPKKLLIAMKARPSEAVDVPQVKVQVFFYDEEGGDLSPSKAQSVSKWISSGTDWKNGEPELLEVRYLPDSADSDIKFGGFIVAIYYKGDLQDYRAEPSRLTKLFPLKYFIGTDE